jgi:intracellular sulfur oxidation DsrE/DsrF family protein
MDPQTGKASERNFVYEPSSGDLLADVIDGIKELQGRGALFAVCNSAIRFHSARIAKKMNLKAADVYKDLTSNILPQIQLVPTGVWAIGMAQEKKCGYIFAG